jgi:hypothetical protein
LGFPAAHRKLDQRHVGIGSDSLLDESGRLPIGVLFPELEFGDQSGEVAETGEDEDVVLDFGGG